MAVRKIFCVFQKVIPLLIKDSQARVDGSITRLNSYRHTRPSALPQALISSGNRYSSGVQGATSLLRLASLTEGGTEKTPLLGFAVKPRCPLPTCQSTAPGGPFNSTKASKRPRTTLFIWNLLWHTIH